MNILFTCAGRRNYLLRYFKNLGDNVGQIIAIDSDALAPALQEADISLVVPRANHPEYIETIVRIVKEYKIGLIIPLNDLELPICLKYQKKVESLGAKVVISPISVINICLDKWKTFRFFESRNFPTPKTYLGIPAACEALTKGEVTFPLVVKPRWGSASYGVSVVDSMEELQLVYKLLHLRLGHSDLNGLSNREKDTIIIQEKVSGNEYGMDILNDFQGKYVASFARKKISMRAGETDKAETVVTWDFEAVAEEVATALGHFGVVDCDFFVDDGKIYLIEINPRFGGGYPFSHESGADIPAIYLSWLRGESDISRYLKYCTGQRFSKCDNIILFSS